MADDLDDEWWREEDSAKEEDDLEASPENQDGCSTKRKVTEHAGVEESSKKKKQKSSTSLEQDAKSSPASPKDKKKKKRKKISDVVASTTSQPPKPTRLISALNAHLLPKLSTVEVDEMTLTDAHFALAPESTACPLADYLHTVLPKWTRRVQRMSDQPGHPLMLIVCAAALRACDIVRDLKLFDGGKPKIVKLFAKHMKAADQKKHLQKSVIHIGVGTPSRIAHLLAEDGLHLDQTCLVVIDWSFRDVKLRRLIDISEIRQDFMTLLQKYFIPRVKTGNAKFALY